jgi:beta-galactosidase beta subunit
MMIIDPTVKIAIIAAIPPTLAALLAAASNILNHRKLTKIHVDINDRVTQLVAASLAQGHAEGVQAERDRQEKRPDA